jgi:DDE superfamily endonuclease
VQPIRPGPLWQAQLDPYAPCFTRPGFRDFLTWGTGLALNVEEHTITQSLVALDRPGDWKALEAFAEHGAWDEHQVERTNARLLEDAPGRIWHGFHVWAGDDTKVHRSSKDVWGTCTFHEYTARCPNRAPTVRAHNWVVVGALLHNPERPAWFVPTAGRLYFRQSQLPGLGNPGEEPARFRTKCELLVELLRVQAQAVPGRHLAVFDGGFALRSVVRPLVRPDDTDLPRIDFVTRLRQDARLFLPPPPPPPPGRPKRRGRPPVWGRRLAPPRQGGRWPGPWRTGDVFLYGRRRRVRYKEVVGLWHVLGHDVPVKVVVAEVEGYKKRFTLVSSATELTGLQIVELFCARFRQEDAFRDLKQRLGWEECRAWTRLPVWRTTLMLFVVLGALRRLEWALDERRGDDWWLHPPWDRSKDRPSVRDVERFLRGHREEIQRHLSAWLGEGENGGGVPARRVAM